MIQKIKGVEKVSTKHLDKLSSEEIFIRGVNYGLFNDLRYNLFEGDLGEAKYRIWKKGIYFGKEKLEESKKRILLDAQHLTQYCKSYTE